MLEARLEGAPFDREVLQAVARRVFQEAQVAVEGLSPDGLVAALLGARERVARD